MTFEVRGRRVWSVTHGAGGDKVPLLCVPGGPATSHHYLAPLAELAAAGRPVIFFDPLGSGGSERPPGAEWSVEVFIEELATLCRGLDRYDLLAQSVGGFAVYPFAATRPPGLRALVLASAPASMPAYQASARRLLAALTPDLEAFERADRGDASARDAGYVRSYQQFLLTHICRVRPTPVAVWQAIQGRNLEANRLMKGGAVLYTSALRHWDVSDQLGAIAIPTLVTCGRHDMLPPDECQRIARAIPGAELEVFEDSSHMAHLEEPERYRQVVAAFLDRVG